MNTMTQTEEATVAPGELDTQEELQRGIVETREKLKNEAGEVFSKACEGAKNRADEMVDETSRKVRNLEEAAEAAKSTMSDEQPAFLVHGWDLLEGRISTVAEYLERKDSREIADDVRAVVRKNPGATLGALAIAGFFAGRFLKAGKPSNAS